MGDTAGMTSAQASNLMDASMATSAVSSIATGFESAAAIKSQGQYASTIANTNAAMANLKASQTLQAGDIEASRQQEKTQAAVGAARAAAGASGVQVNAGSPAMVRAGMETAGGIDVATIRNNAARSAWGYQTQAIEDTYQGQFDTLTAKAKSEQTLATGGLQAINGPLGIYAQSALWQYRYGMKGQPGVPYPDASPGGGSFPGASMGTAASEGVDQDDSFWSGAD